MKRSGAFALAMAATAVATLTGQAATAQARSTADYVCILAGTCPEKAGSVSRDPTVPLAGGYRNQGFALARPARANLALSFPSGSAVLTRDGMAEARTIAAALGDAKLAARRYRIEGHTDSVGNRAYNLDLSRRRAASVVAYLTRLGVARGRLEARGYAFDRPLPGVPASAAQNRRVEAVSLP